MKANRQYKQISESPKPIIVCEGGTSSGKTYAIMQYLLNEAVSKPNKVITVVGQDIPNLKVGAYRDAKEIIEQHEYLKEYLVFINKSERTIEFESGSIIEFNSYKDEQDAKSGKRTHAFFNEANGIPHGIFEQINMRTSEKTIVDFNPSLRFWAHNKLFGLDNVEWIKSTFRDNAFLNENVKQKILSYKPTEENIAAGTANEYRWKVYGLGEVGKLEGLVFPEFEVSEDIPQNYKWRVYGLDFGFTNDPTSLIEVTYAHGQLYFKELIYNTGMTNQDIYESIDNLNIDIHSITADSAEPKSIEELNRLGLNVQPAKKGKDSINYGIDLLQNYKLNVYYKSKNLIEEFNSYRWKEDREGHSTNKPIDKFNHGIDAIRYATMGQLSSNDDVYMEVIEF